MEKKKKNGAKDDVFFLKKITSLHILKLMKLLQTFFATWLLLGKIAILFGAEDKGSKIGKGSKEPSPGVSVTC